MSKDAVERLAKEFEGGHPAGPLYRVAATLRALSDRLAEVEAANRGLVRLNEATQARAEAAEARLAEVEAERDRQYDENVDRIAQQAAAESRAEAAEAKLSVAREILSGNVIGAEMEDREAIETALTTLDADTTPAPEVSVGAAKEYAIDTIEEIIGETHDIDVTDRRYAENIVAWLEMHHPAALRALAGEEG